MAPDIVVDVHINDEAGAGAPLELLSRAVRFVLTSEGVGEGEVSLTLLNDAGIRSLNLEYLDRDSVTDVIAFTLSAEGEPLLGDIYLGFDQAVRQAAQLGIEAPEELARLAIHGALHLLGHDHPEGEERLQSSMWALQETLLARLLDADS